MLLLAISSTVARLRKSKQDISQLHLEDVFPLTKVPPGRPTRLARHQLHRATDVHRLCEPRELHSSLIPSWTRWPGAAQVAGPGRIVDDSVDQLLKSRQREG
jgi:hypothetical protein